MLTTGGLSYLFATADGTTAESRPIQQAQVVAAPATTNSLPQPTTADPATGPAATAPQTVTSAARVSTVDGGVYSNRYGNVQVEVQFGPGGVLSAARALQAPAGAARSIRINDSAVPALNSEALSAQSANVDAVSGATYTTESYRSSLQSAIDAARTQGITRLS